MCDCIMWLGALPTGEVTVTPTGGTPVLIQAGDLVKFPKGMTCKWDGELAHKHTWTHDVYQGRDTGGSRVSVWLSVCSDQSDQEILHI